MKLNKNNAENGYYGKIDPLPYLGRMSVVSDFSVKEISWKVSLKKGEEVVLTGFGAFSVKARAARTGVNPQNPTEKIQIPTVKVPKFKAGKSLKDALKNN